jgi:hypothetical protein
MNTQSKIRYISDESERQAYVCLNDFLNLLKEEDIISSTQLRVYANRIKTEVFKQLLKRGVNGGYQVIVPKKECYFIYKYSYESIVMKVFSKLPKVYENPRFKSLINEMDSSPYSMLESDNFIKIPTFLD